MPQVKLSFNLDLSSDSTWLTVTASQAARASIAYVQELGDFHCGPNYYTNREHLQSYLIKLCVSGEGMLDYGGESYVIRPGQLFWINCRRLQYYRTSSRSGDWRVIWVHFHGVPCEGYYQLFLAQNDGCPVVDLGQGVECRSLLEMLIRLYRDGGNTLQDDVQASSLLTQLMCRLIQAVGQRSGRAHLPEYVTDARSYINMHYADRITLDSLSQLFNINKFYMQKLFKQHMGLSPNEYLIHTRLNRAKQLLRTTAAPISQIAMDVGINNIGHFISLFKKYEGCTPNAYRQNWYNSEGGYYWQTEPQQTDGAEE